MRLIIPGEVSEAKIGQVSYDVFFVGFSATPLLQSRFDEAGPRKKQ